MAVAAIGGGAEALTALIVDDEPVNRTLLGRMLREQGFADRRGSQRS